MGRQGRMRVEKGIADLLCAVAVGKVQEQGVAGGALDDRPDRESIGAARDQVTLPVAGDEPVGNVGRTLVDHHHRGDEPSEALT